MNTQDFELKEYANEREWAISEAFPVLMRKVYVWMTLALVITGLTAYGVATSPGVLQAIYGNQLFFWGLIIAEFALVVGVSAAINRISLTTATLMFILYSVINGALMSYVFLVYTASSISIVFFITAGTFAAMALFGYTTKTDLTSMGKILLMALIGLVIATLVNVFVRSSGLTLILSYVGDDRDIHFDSMAMGQGATMALPIFAYFMQRVYKDGRLGYNENAVFDMPSGYNPCDTETSELEDIDEGSIEDVYE